ncbi:hypothetical protein EVAR_52269_1 [Eumeta japonica]|uniref:Uncharacterized protein n=1 Tax=Eumeta variegata TaxID=151549 RepID=A0A4C1YUB7_EUMVA|nr:hypothetical protein EVAR_52269_1 [Eumeta japonica]
MPIDTILLNAWPAAIASAAPTRRAACPAHVTNYDSAPRDDIRRDRKIIADTCILHTSQMCDNMQELLRLVAGGYTARPPVPTARPAPARRPAANGKLLWPFIMGHVALWWYASNHEGDGIFGERNEDGVQGQK